MYFASYLLILIKPQILKMHQETLQYFDPFYDQISYNYSGSVQLEEILHFLDLAFPKWKTNCGLGTFAPEFVNWLLEHTSESFQDDSFLNFLNLLYLEIADEYSKYEESQAFSFDLECIKHFPEDSETSYDALSGFEYKVELEKFKASRREINAFDFIF